MNDAGVCCITERTDFNVFICLNHNWWDKQNEIEYDMTKQDI